MLFFFTLATGVVRLLSDIILPINDIIFTMLGIFVLLTLIHSVTFLYNG